MSPVPFFRSDSQLGSVPLPSRPRFRGRAGSFLQRPASCCGAARRPCPGEAAAGGGRGGELAQPPGRHAALDRAEERQRGHGAPCPRCRSSDLIRSLALSLCLLAPVSGGAQDLSSNAQLLVAARQGDLALAKRLLEGGAAVNSRNRLGDTPLLIALKNGNGDMARHVPVAVLPI